MARDFLTPDSGLVDDFSAEVVEDWFATDSRNQNNPEALYKFMRVQLDNPQDYPSLEGGETTLRYSCGESWQSIDGGETADFPGNDGKMFHANSSYGKFVQRCVDLGMKDLLIARGGDSRVSKLWTGLRFHFMVDTFPMNIPGATQSSYNVTLPSEFLGEADGSGSAGQAVDFDTASLGLPDELLNEVIQAASESSNNGIFADKVLALTGARENDKLMSALSNDGLFKAIKPI